MTGNSYLVYNWHLALGFLLNKALLRCNYSQTKLLCAWAYYLCLRSLQSQRIVLYCRIYSNVPGRTSEQKSRPSVSDFSTVVAHYQSLLTHNFPLKHPTRF